MLSVEIFNPVISSLVVLAQILSVVLLGGLLFARNSKFMQFVSSKSVLGILIVSLVATLGSLYYSEIAGYEPCKLCWLQRIFIYPQVLIAAIALCKKDKIANYYLVTMSLLALSIATFHYLGQLGFTDLSCGLAGYSAKCSERFVMNFGYITIPMMALSAAGLNFLMGLAGVVIKPKD